MIYVTQNGIRVDDEEWAGSLPNPGPDPKSSFITIRFQNGAQLVITEAVLKHAIHLIEHVRVQD